MNDLIAVFRMKELSVVTRIKIIKKLGSAINSQYGSNLTEALVYELVIALDPLDEIKDSEHFRKFI